MNIQAMMKQAQKLQKDMLDSKKEIDSKTFEITKSFVTIEAMGNKKIKNIKINLETIEKDEIEMLEDLISSAMKTATEKANMQ